MPIPKGEKKTDAERAARNKYQAKTYATLGCKLDIATANAFRSYADKTGVAVSALLGDFVRSTLDAAGMLPAPKAPADPVQDDGTGDQ